MNRHHDHRSSELSEEISIEFYCLVSVSAFLMCFITLYAVPMINQLVNQSYRVKLFCVSRYQHLMAQLLSCIGGGALLGLAMIDILPELRERLEATPQGVVPDHYPLAELGMITATFIVAILDALIQRCFQIDDQFHGHSKPEKRKRKDSAIIEEDGPSDREEFLPGQAKTDFNRKPKIGKITKIIAGLSLHSVLTGMSIGMVDTKDQLIAGLIALIPHKVAVLILLSTMTLEINQMSRFLHITTFSMALPSGIMLSLIVSKIEDGMVLCGFEALGCGAVFYVAIIEMLPNSLEGDWKILKYFTVLAGIGIIAGIQVLHSHEHAEHEHGHGHLDIDAPVDDYVKNFSVRIDST